MDRVKDWLDGLRYERPAWFWVLMFATGSVVCAFGFMLLPDTPMLRAMGITGVQRRISASTHGVSWSMRALINRDGATECIQVFGNVEGVDYGGMVVVTVAQADNWRQFSLTLANTQVTDLMGVARIIAKLKAENARFDIYPQGQTVVWIHNVPLNVKLIEAGVAKPDPNPPTNIYDRAFATYYWEIAKGRESDAGR